MSLPDWLTFALGFALGVGLFWLIVFAASEVVYRVRLRRGVSRFDAYPRWFL